MNKKIIATLVALAGLSLGLLAIPASSWTSGSYYGSTQATTYQDADQSISQDATAKTSGKSFVSVSANKQVADADLHQNAKTYAKGDSYTSAKTVQKADQYVDQDAVAKTSGKSFTSISANKQVADADVTQNAKTVAKSDSKKGYHKSKHYGW